MKRGVSRVLGCVAIALLAARAAPAEVIDRILAVVEGQLITLSDVRAVIRLGLETPPDTGDPIRQVLDTLIERQLILVEVERYAPPEPPPEEVEPRLSAIRGRFADALAFEVTLHHVGMTADHLRRYIRDTLRIESYLQQRFAAAIPPNDDEVAAYYRLHAADFMRNGTLAPYEQVRVAVRARLVEERRRGLVRDWLASLRRRADIVDLNLAR